MANDGKAALARSAPDVEATAEQPLVTGSAWLTLVPACAGIAFALIVAVWTFRFWDTLRQAAPILDVFRAEHGPGEMTFDDWRTAEATEVFCPHPDGVAATNRFGRYVDAGEVYAPALAVIGLPLLLTGTFLALVNYAAGGRQRWVAWLIMATMGITAAVFIMYSGDIGALTNINE